ncbi:MAG: IPT/TIG domain-containing protein [Nitrospirales bacterium]
MEDSWTMKRLAMRVGITTGLMATLLAGPLAYAGSATAPPAIVAKAPVCDPSSHPKIVKVTPDTVKPGDKVTIKGKHFGTKECFHNVSFGPSGTTFTYVNETTLEATVPSLKAGLTPINVLTEGGSSQSVVLVNAK